MPLPRASSTPAALLLGAGAGLLAAGLLPPGPGLLGHGLTRFVPLTVVGSLLVALLAGRLLRTAGTRLFFLAGLGLGLAVTLPARPRPFPGGHASGFGPSPREVLLPAVGIISDLRAFGRRRRARLRLGSLDGAPAHFSLSVNLPAFIPPLREGDRVALHLRPRPWPRAKNPGAPDESAHLVRAGISGRARVRDLVRLASPRRGLGARLRARLDEHLGLARHEVARAIDDLEVRESVRGVLHALGLGDRGAIPRPTRRAFARAGLAHLLAISGLHLGLLVLGGLALLRRFFLWLGSLRGLALLPGLHTFAAGPPAGLAFVGTGLLLTWVAHPTSGLRAAAMVLPLLLALALHRRSSTARTLGLALLGLGLLEPGLLLELGFQLSAAAATGLVFGLRRTPGPSASRLAAGAPPRVAPGIVARLGARTWATLRGTFWATFWASIATAPLLLHHFGRLPLTGLAANFVAIPLTVLLLASLAPAVAAVALLGPLASPLLLPATWLARALLATTEAAAACPLASVVLPPSTALQEGIFVLLLGTALLLGVRPGLRRGLALLALAVLVWPGQQAARRPAPLEITFLAVGHGDAILIRTPRGDLLIDGGGDHQDARAIGERVVVPALRALGVRRLAAVLLTHPHPDHHGGLPAVLEAFPVGALYLGGDGIDPGGPLDRLRRVARRENVPVRFACRAPLPDLRPVILSCLGPRGFDPEGPYDPLESPNDNSVTLMIRLHAVSFLLPGDLEAPGEAALLSLPGLDLRATVLKAPHHGSDTSSTSAFVQRVAPRHVVYSVGAESRFRFPRPSVLARYAALGARAHRTDRDGAILFWTDGHTLRVRHFLRSEDGRSATGDGSPGPPAPRGPILPRAIAPDARDGRG